METEVYVSIDVETSGPVPSPFSMLSLGAVAFTRQGEVGEWYGKFDPPGKDWQHSWDNDTLKWWSKYPDALTEALTDPERVAAGMERFLDWCRRRSPGKITIVASPAGFDGMFLNWYAIRFGGTGKFEDLPWKHRVLDLRSFAAGKLGIPYHDAHNSVVCERIGFKPSVRHDHNALNDARGQGEIFMALLAWEG